jgi:hypothetical protein
MASKLLTDIIHHLTNVSTISPDEIIEPADAIIDECSYED